MARSSTTPMFRQYHDIKSRYRDAILMFRMGDFYEMFHDDALAASRTLAITLTARGKGTGAEAPMCGVPHHAAEGYIAKLTDAGYKVAICEQLEDPATVKGLVKRDVVRVVTPGTLTSAQHLEATEPNSLAALNVGGQRLGVAWVDLSTGDFRIATLEGEGKATRAVDLLARFNCRELLLPPDVDLHLGDGLGQILVSRRDGWQFSSERAHDALTRHLGTAHLSGYGIEGMDEAIGAAGALLEYLAETQKTDLAHIDRLTPFQEADHLILDGTTLRNLEILRTQRDGKRRGSLVDIVDTTITAMGGRLLKERLVHPLRDPAAIARRLAAVGDLVEHSALRARMRQAMDSIADLERLLGRLTLGPGNPRDLRGLGDSLALLPTLRDLAGRAVAPALSEEQKRLDTCDDVAGLVAGALVDEPPTHLRDGGVIREGHDDDLDALRRLAVDGKTVLAEIETRERARTGITSLKVRYNRVFGYFIEVSKSNLSRVPDDYIRKQTLAGSERYMTPELKETEETVLTAQDRMVTREEELFSTLRRSVLAHASRIRAAAAAVARIDVSAALAETASRLDWCRPEVNSGQAIRITGGRHPAVEAAVGRDLFVPNDIDLGQQRRQLQIITGPNMGGKSTLLRQVGLIVALAQAGSFVPAGAACVGVADRIFCRVGASDSLARGHSTFMVEMTETANILHNATPRSLVLLDEIGRGTATFDGLSIAWAVVEHLHDTVEATAWTLFATHYHELTELALVLPRVVNLRMAAREHAGRIVFLHRVEEGAADQSYGIQVAALAGVPPEVVARAREILVNLESAAVGEDGRPTIAKQARRNREQLTLFADPADPPRLGGRAASLARKRHPPQQPAPAGNAEPALFRDDAAHDVAASLRELSPEQLSPLEALQILD
ncbi:MAG: DNA mismatch repair protein MutS, partial [Acidobacteriota bacterium]